MNDIRADGIVEQFKRILPVVPDREHLHHGGTVRFKKVCKFNDADIVLFVICDYAANEFLNLFHERCVNRVIRTIGHHRFLIHRNNILSNIFPGVLEDQIIRMEHRFGQSDIALIPVP